MANEVQVRAQLSVRTSQLQYLSRPASYNANMPNGNNPAQRISGTVNATIGGVNINTGGLVQPGLTFIQNLSTLTNSSSTDNTGMVEYGIWDPTVNRFHPLGELIPGEFHIIRLSRHLHVEYGTGPGTGTIAGVHTNSLRVRSMTNTPQLVLFDIFES